MKLKYVALLLVGILIQILAFVFYVYGKIVEGDIVFACGVACAYFGTLRVIEWLQDTWNTRIGKHDSHY